MKYLKILLIPLSVVLLVAYGRCEFDQSVHRADNNSREASVWVAINSAMDTLIFSPEHYTYYIQVSRGEELVDGVMLPKVGSGYYAYGIDDGANELILYDYYGSDDFQSFVLEITDTQLTVENFFDPDPDHLGKLLTSRKVFPI